MHSPSLQPPLPAAHESETFRLYVPYTGAKPSYAKGKVSVYGFVLHDRPGLRQAVVMVDGGQGASITNAAEEIVAFIGALHCASRGLALKNARWFYRDGQGHWDEILPNDTETCAFRPVGSRTLDALLVALTRYGLPLTPAEHKALQLAMLDADKTALLKPQA